MSVFTVSFVNVVCAVDDGFYRCLYYCCYCRCSVTANFDSVVVIVVVISANLVVEDMTDHHANWEPVTL